MPYGYAPEKATALELVRAENERKTAEYIRRLRAEGSTFARIREILTTVGVSPRNGGKWQLSSIRKIAQSD